MGWSADGRCRNRKTWWRSQTLRFFLRAAIFRSLLRTSVPSEQSLAASRFHSSTLMLFLLLERDLLKSTPSPRTGDRILCVGLLGLHRGHDGIAISHLTDFIHILCGETEHLRFQKLPGASSARATGGKPATGRCWTSVICDVHGGGRSGGRVELRPRFTMCSQSWDISLVLLPSAWPYAALFSSNPASPCVQSLTSIACSDMPDTFFFHANCVRERRPPCMSSAVLYVVRSRHLSRLPEDSTMRLFVSLVSTVVLWGRRVFVG